MSGRCPAARGAAPVVGASLLTVAVVAAVALLLAARTSGMSYWGTSPALVAGFPVAVLVTTSLAWRIHRRGDVVVGRWVLAVAASLLLYLVATATVTWWVAVQDRGGPALDWLALLALGGYVPAFVLLQATLVVVRDRLAGQSRGRLLIAGLLVLGALSLVAGAAELDPDPPLDAVDPPLAGTWVAAVAPQVSGVLYVTWLLSVLVGPVVLWRAVRRATGMARRRLSVAAVVSLLPVSTIVCCALLLPVLTVADLPETVAVDVVFTFFAVAFTLTAAGLAVAFSGPDDGLRLRSGALQLSLDVAVGVLFVLSAVAVSTLAAVTLAGGSVPVVVVATVAVVMVLWPVRRSAVRRLMLRADPRLGVAAALVRATEKERDSRPARSARRVLRTALDDDALDVAVRLPGGQAWQSVDGVAMPPPADQPAAHVTTVPDAEGEPHAYVLHSTTTGDAEGTVAEVRPLLDRAVLEVAVRHQAEQLAAERARADDAAAAERRRLERDLHDGVQGRLLAVALDLQAADAGTTDGEAHLVLSDAVSSLRVAIDEMRRLASGTAPELLGRDGLAAALDALARRMPVPVTLSVPRQRLDPATETVAYLVVTEAMTNAVKHAGQCTVDVDVRLDDGQLGIRVTDTGPGGADVRAGTGLRGLTERVSAAGGTLVVSDRRPSGTLLEVVLPCGR